MTNPFEIPFLAPLHDEARKEDARDYAHEKEELRNELAAEVYMDMTENRLGGDWDDAGYDIL